MSNRTGERDSQSESRTEKVEVSGCFGDPKVGVGMVGVKTR